MSKVGGSEIGAIAGSILAAAHAQRPVVIDGFISTAGALLAVTLCPKGLMLEHLGVEPLLQLGLRLGEGSGGALPMHLIEASIPIFRDMMTFESAGLSER